MPQVDQSTIDDIKTKIGILADATLSKYANEAKTEANKFLEDSKATVILWKDQLASDKITIAEFEYLVGGLADIAELKILKNAQLAKQRTLQFIGSVINIIIDVILKQVKP